MTFAAPQRHQRCRYASIGGSRQQLCSHCRFWSSQRTDWPKPAPYFATSPEVSRPSSGHHSSNPVTPGLPHPAPSAHGLSRPSTAYACSNLPGLFHPGAALGIQRTTGMQPIGGAAVRIRPTTWMLTTEAAVCTVSSVAALPHSLHLSVAFVVHPRHRKRRKEEGDDNRHCVCCSRRSKSSAPVGIAHEHPNQRPA